MKGKENKVVDSLRRRVHGLFEIIISRAESDLEQRIKTTVNNDENYTQTVEELQNPIGNLDKIDMSLEKNCLL